MIPPVPFIVIGVILFVLFVVWVHHQEKERAKMLAAFAASQGWKFDGRKRRPLLDEFPDFPLFNKGGSRHGKNFMSGFHEGHGLLAFEYYYSTSAGKSRRGHRYTVILLHPPFPLKPLQIRPKGLLDKVASAFGWKDIDFKSNEFSRRFHVTGPDRHWAFDVLTPRNMEFLMNRGTPSVSMNDLLLMVPVEGWGGPQAILAALATGTGLLDGIPRFAGSNA